MRLLKKMQNKESCLFILFFVLASLVYLYNITFSDLWIDETFTKKIIEFPIPRMLDLLAGDFHPPLYFLVLKAFTTVFGNSNFSIRLFSVIGVLCTFILSYFAGQRVFGKKGALIFCMAILSIPMLAANSHNARMYTWAAFSVSGVFLYSFLYLKIQTKRDLIFLGLMTLIAAYTHYYALIAAFWSNLFVFLYLIAAKKKGWIAHLAAMVSVLILYLPWIFVFLSQTNAADKDYYIQSIDITTILSCYLGPFVKMFWLEIPSYVMILTMFILTIISSINVFFKGTNEDKVILGLALSIYNLTILTGIVISFVLRPMLMARYVGPILTMLAVPPALFIMRTKIAWLKPALLLLLLGCGIYLSISASGISMGPYKQAMEQLRKNHPEVEKIIHATEVTTGPLLEYHAIGNWEQYWLDNDSAVYYTNIDVFTDLHRVPSLEALLSPGEPFCVVDMGAKITDNPLNRGNLNMMLSRSHLTEIDTIRDARSQSPIALRFYILEYQDSALTGEQF